MDSLNNTTIFKNNLMPDKKREYENPLVKNKIFLMRHGFSNFSAQNNILQGMHIEVTAYCKKCECDTVHRKGYTSDLLRTKHFDKAASEGMQKQEVIDILIRYANYSACRICAARRDKQEKDKQLQDIKKQARAHKRRNLL